MLQGTVTAVSLRGPFCFDTMRFAAWYARFRQAAHQIQTMLRLFTLVVSIAAATPSVAAPLIEAIYERGEVLNGADQIPGFIEPEPGVFPDPGVAGDVVRSNGQGDVRALPNGNFVGRVNTNPQQIGIGAFPSTTSRTSGIHYVFGSDNGGVTPRAFIREATVASEEQLEFTGDAGVDYQGNLSYVANLRDPANPQISTRNSLWENQTPVLIEDDQFTAGPLSGMFFNFAAGVYRTPAGETSWITGFTDTQGTDSTGTALVRGTSTFDVLLQSGDTVTGLGTLEVGGLANIEWSLLGTNYVAKVDVGPGFTSTDEAIAVNGAGIFTASDGLVREGELIPAADGGLPGEVWTGFQFLDVTESGDVAFGAFTSGPDGFDDVIVVNGEVRYREGDVVDGVTLSGQVLGVALNDRGDVAFTWNETLFINDRKIAEIGTLIDSDGDGVADAPIDGTALSLGGLEITNLPAAGGDGLPVVYFSGEFNGGRDAYFRLVASDLAGDYNGDGVVNAADYAVYRETLDSEVLLAADGDGDNVVDTDDYAIWAANLGATATTAVSVPEPTALALAFGCLLCGISCRWSLSAAVG